MAYGNHRAVHETNARALSKTLDAHEGHQLEEHARHEFHETRVGHGLREVACHMLLDEEEVIVLEVAERAKMIAQQDGHDFALGHLSFTVSHSLISLVHGAIWRFLVNSVSKFLQKSSNTQNIYVTLSVAIIAIHVCKLLIFNYKDEKQWRDYQLFREFSYPELALLKGASGALSISVSTRALVTTPSKRTLKKWNCVGA